MYDNKQIPSHAFSSEGLWPWAERRSDTSLTLPFYRNFTFLSNGRFTFLPNWPSQFQAPIRVAKFWADFENFILGQLLSHATAALHGSRHYQTRIRSLFIWVSLKDYAFSNAKLACLLNFPWKGNGHIGMAWPDSLDVVIRKEGIGPEACLSISYYSPPDRPNNERFSF